MAKTKKVLKEVEKLTIREELDKRAEENESLGIEGKPTTSTVNGWTVDKYASGLRIAKLTVTKTLGATQSLPIASVVDNAETGSTVSPTSLVQIGMEFEENFPAGVFKEEPMSVNVTWRLAKGKDNNLILFNSISEVYNATTTGKHRPIIVRMLESTQVPEQLLMDIVVIGH